MRIRSKMIGFKFTIESFCIVAPPTDLDDAPISDAPTPHLVPTLLVIILSFEHLANENFFLFNPKI